MSINGDRRLSGASETGGNLHPRRQRYPSLSHSVYRLAPLASLNRRQRADTDTVPHATIWLKCCFGDWYCAASDRDRCYRTGLGAILGLFGSDRAGTALARQRSVARFWG